MDDQPLRLSQVPLKPREQKQGRAYNPPRPEQVDQFVSSLLQSLRRRNFRRRLRLPRPQNPGPSHLDQLLQRLKNPAGK